MSFSSLLTHNAFVGKRTTSTADSLGYPAVRFVFSSTASPCRIQSISRMNSRISGGETANVVSTHRMFCGVSVPAVERDRVRFNGVDYEVMFVEDAGGCGHHLEIDLVRVMP